MNVRRLFTALLFLLLPCVLAATEIKPRIAICEFGKESSIQADLLFADLSKSKQLTLVERGEIKNVVKEWMDWSMSHDDTIRLGRMLKADGLIFVGTDADFLHIILVNTRRRQQLFDMVRSRPDYSPEKTSQAAGQLVIGALPRLASSGRNEHRICVMPLEHAGVPSNLRGGTVQWESLRIMTGLIAARLASTPGIVVVERTHLKDVLWESFIDGTESNNLSTATAFLQGSVYYLGENPESRFRLTMQFKPIGTQGGTSSDFETTETGLPSCADAIAGWVAGLVEIKHKPNPSVLAQEAAMHYANGLLFQTSGQNDPLPSFEMSYLLQPTNRQYSSTLLSLLIQRNQHEAILDEQMRGVAVPLGKKLEWFSLSMDLSRLLDSAARNPCVPMPAFMLSVPTNIATTCRIAILPTRDTRAPRKNEGAKATRRFMSLIAEDSAFEVANQATVQETIHKLSLDDVDLLYAGTNTLVGLTKALAVDCVVANSIYDEEPRLQLRFLVIGGGPNLTGSCTGVGQPDREPIVGSIRELVYIIRNRQHRIGTTVTPQERESYMACRKQAEVYYKWYCDWEHGVPDSSRRSLLANASPAFFESPEEAMGFLRPLLINHDFDDGVLTNPVFLRITNWDKARAQNIWNEFLQDIQHHSPVQTTETK